MKYIRKLIPIILLILFLISMIVYSDVVIKSVSFAVTLCINNLFPSMLPFLILSSILSNYGFVELVSHILSPLMRNLFHINSNCAYILILSMLSGSPSNAKYIKELLDSNKITTGDANKVLLFSHFVNPIFIIGTVGTIFLGNKIYGFIILISHYLANLIIGIMLRKKSIPESIPNNNFFNIKPIGFITTLKSAIKDTIDTLLVVFGTITSTLVFSSIINAYFNFNPVFNGILEVTSGLKYLSIESNTILFKIIISTFFISFGGLSIHAQVMSILDNKSIKYIPYLEARILQGLISSIIVYILYMLINNI